MCENEAYYDVFGENNDADLQMVASNSSNEQIVERSEISECS